MKKKICIIIPIIVLIAVGVLAGLLLFRPGLETRLDIWTTKLRVIFQPVGALPTAGPAALLTTSTANPTLPIPSATVTLAVTATPLPPTQTPFPSPTPLPRQIKLPSPEFELQDWNNCGPDALALYLRFYGWQGDQFTISKLIKPARADRNVNVDELAGFVRQNLGQFRAEYRVGGSLNLLRQFVAAGFPVLVEETFYFEQPFWTNDDLWGGHYLLITGYNDEAQTFLTQDSYLGADQYISYAKLDENWQAFNRVYMLVYRPEDEDKIKMILGADWDVDQNRQNALALSQRETVDKPNNAFAWFNLGTNLVYFSQYAESAQAYDRARSLNLPQRMLRYQFGPFLAYFHSGRTDDLMTLVEYALKATPNSEEALLWQGWGLYRLGQNDKALASFGKALEVRPDYGDALYALDYVKNN